MGKECVFYSILFVPPYIPLEEREEGWSWLYQLPQKYSLYSILLPPIPHSYPILREVKAVRNFFTYESSSVLVRIL